MNESRNNKDRVRMSPLSDPQIHHPITVAQQGLPHCEWVRIKKLVQECRVGTLNIGTMTGKGRALADIMKRRRVDAMCVQETKWAGNKTKELGEGY
jgi:hypothetical protein